MTEIAPKTALAAFTRDQVADHDEWDSPHAFMTLHNIDGEIKVGMYAMITPDFPPDQYKRAITGMALDFLRRYDADDDVMATDDGKLPPPCAYLLQIEAHIAIIPPDASKADREQLDRDADNRQIHARPDAVEICNAVCADVHGRVYMATKRRDTGEVDEQFSGPLNNTIRGRFANALLAIAHATGMSHWGLPGPIPLNN